MKDLDIKMNINYDYYRIFYHVAKYKNFTQAAAALMNNQPNITRTIKNLESELGCTLFIRSNRGVTLTPEGEKLYAHIAVAFEHIDTAEKELSSDLGLQSGIVSIGASEVALHCLLLPVLKKFRQLYPGVRIRVSNHSTPQAITALKNGLVDLAVVTTPLVLPEYIQRTVLKTIQEVAVSSTAYSFLAKKQLPLAELARYPLICLDSQTATYALYADWFAQNGLSLEPDIEAATADQILPMIKNDLGIGFVPEEFLENESESTEICRLSLQEKIPARSICLLKRTNHSLSIAAKELEKKILKG